MLLAGRGAATYGHAHVASSSALKVPAVVWSHSLPVPVPAPKATSASTTLLPIHPPTSTAGRQERLCSLSVFLRPRPSFRLPRTYAHLSVGGLAVSGAVFSLSSYHRCLPVCWSTSQPNKLCLSGLSDSVPRHLHWHCSCCIASTWVRPSLRLLRPGSLICVRPRCVV